MPRTTFTFFPPTLNSTSTIHPLAFTVLRSCGLLMLRKGLPNNPKHSASSTVDFPAPFSPMMSVVEFLFSCISVKLFPVDKKFFHLTHSKVIKFPNPVLQYIRFSLYFSVYLYLGLRATRQYIFPAVSSYLLNFQRYRLIHCLHPSLKSLQRS